MKTVKSTLGIVSLAMFVMAEVMVLHWFSDESFANARPMFVANIVSFQPVVESVDSLTRLAQARSDGLHPEGDDNALRNAMLSLVDSPALASASREQRREFRLQLFLLCNRAQSRIQQFDVAKAQIEDETSLVRRSQWGNYALSALSSGRIERGDQRFLEGKELDVVRSALASCPDSLALVDEVALSYVTVLRYAQRRAVVDDAERAVGLEDLDSQLVEALARPDLTASDFAQDRRNILLSAAQSWAKAGRFEDLARVVRRSETVSFVGLSVPPLADQILDSIVVETGYPVEVRILALRACSAGQPVSASHIRRCWSIALNLMVVDGWSGAAAERAMPWIEEVRAAPQPVLDELDADSVNKLRSAGYEALVVTASGRPFSAQVLESRLHCAVALKRPFAEQAALASELLTRFPAYPNNRQARRVLGR